MHCDAKQTIATVDRKNVRNAVVIIHTSSTRVAVPLYRYTRVPHSVKMKSVQGRGEVGTGWGAV